jgi:AcrR family transcriptional regulator
MGRSDVSDRPQVAAAPGLAPADTVEQRVIEAALRCIARWGVAKTTVEDVAREAGCSRATIYRTFDGGKEGILAAAIDHELVRLLAVLADELPADGSLEDVLVVGLTVGSRFLTSHEALGFLVAHELDLVLPLIAFDRMDALLAQLGAAAQPWLAPHLGPEQAQLVAEWMVRLVLSYVALPSDTIDLTNEASARRLVRRYVLPGLTAQRTPTEPPTATTPAA